MSDDTTDRYWRWKIEYSPEVIANTIANLRALGYTREPARWPTASNPDEPGVHTEWRRPSAGYVFGVLTDETGREWLSSHAVDRYGHTLPPCTECGLPIEAGEARLGQCFTCRFWLEKIATRDKFIIAVAWSRISSFQDCGNWPGVRGQDRSHLGFGGARFKITRLSDGHTWETNNLYTQGAVPERFRDRLPITHELTQVDDGC